VVAQIGAGGMGEVYRARDTQLHRDVALKVLPDVFASDSDRLARLTREAQVLASLNHPHIATIYGFENAGGTTALVLELVDGETLADRIARGPIPVDAALSIASQIAQALEAAHEQGIVHRDLKPANIKVRPDGTVKVLDFGLAKALEPVPGSGSPLTATITTPARTSAAGTILGTAAYMSPEQAAGHTADRRSDVWAFGVVLMEMLTGRRVFSGETVSRVVASVLEDEPDWKQLPKSTPTSIRTLLRRCLEKDRRRRLDSAAAARLEIDDAIEYGADTETPARRFRRETLVWIASAVLAVTAIVLAIRLFRSPPVVERRAQKFSLLPPTDATVNRDYVALAPNGLSVAFVATAADGRAQLWIRSLDGLTARPFAGTDDARLPFWSPDSRFIGFFAEHKLKKIQASGGPVQIICDAPYGFGGTWNRDGVIVFSSDIGTALSSVSANGGTPHQATRLDATRGEGFHVAPAFLPDGRHFLYAANEPRKDPPQKPRLTILVGSLDAMPPRPLVESDSMSLYAHGPGAADGAGYLLYVRDNALLAQPFDAGSYTLTGEAVPVGDGAIQVVNVGRTAPFSVSDTGLLAYRSSTANTQLAWFDRAGKRMRTLDAPAGYDEVELSPDGHRIAVGRIDPHSGVSNLWLSDVDGESFSQVTFAFTRLPRWSLDNKTLTFEQFPRVVRKRVDGTGTEEVLYEGSDPAVTAFCDVSPDGRTVAFRSVPGTGRGSEAGSLWVVPAASAVKPTQIPQTESRGFNARFSPDGKWLAYNSNESGIMEVYVQPFPSTGAKWKVSQNGGIRPLWRRDGKELFFVASGNVNGVGLLTAVPIETTTTIRIGAPHAIVNAPFVPSTANVYPFAVSADGQRVLLVEPVDDHSGITVVLDWMAALK
jgi:Tol biopolymer transport system component